MKPIRKAIDDNIEDLREGKTKLVLVEDADAACYGASALGWKYKKIIKQSRDIKFKKCQDSKALLRDVESEKSMRP